MERLSRLTFRARLSRLGSLWRRARLSRLGSLWRRHARGPCACTLVMHDAQKTVLPTGQVLVHNFFLVSCLNNLATTTTKIAKLIIVHACPGRPTFRLFPTGLSYCYKASIGETTIAYSRKQRTHHPDPRQMSS